MLYINRKQGEAVVIHSPHHGDIEVSITQIKGNRVQIGFIFPDTCTILRKEIHTKVLEENLKAASLEPTNELDLVLSGEFSNNPKQKG